MEARVAKLEAAVEHIQSDIKDVKADLRALTAKFDSGFIVLAGMILAVAVGLASLLAKGFHWL